MNKIGSTFDSFLEEQGIKEEVEAAALERINNHFRALENAAARTRFIECKNSHLFYYEDSNHAHAKNH